MTSYSAPMGKIARVPIFEPGPLLDPYLKDNDALIEPAEDFTIAINYHLLEENAGGRFLIKCLFKRDLINRCFLSFKSFLMACQMIL